MNDYEVVMVNTKSGEEFFSEYTHLSHKAACEIANKYNLLAAETDREYSAIIKQMGCELKKPKHVQLELSFEDRCIETMKQRMLSQLEKTDIIMSDRGNCVKIPSSFYEKCWDLVDHDALMKKIAQNLEHELADRIVNDIATEIATDIKQLLSDKDRREIIRGKAREVINQLGGK